MPSNEAAIEPEINTRGKMLVILVDEEKVVLRTLGDFLADLDHEVITFESVSDLLESAKPGTREYELTSSANLILMDTGAPKDLQESIIAKVHAKFPGADILLMSEYRVTLPHDAAIANRVFGYLAKPVLLGELELSLARINEGRHGRP